MEKDENKDLPEIETMTIKNEAGEEIEVVKKESFDQFQQGINSKLEETNKALEAVNTDLEKERAKDKNFSNLRKAKLSELSEEEAAKLSEIEKGLMERQEALDNQMNSFQTMQQESWKTKAMADLGVNDEETQKKVLGQYDRLIDKADTPEQVAAKMRTAYSLAHEGKIPTGERGIAGAIPHGGGGHSPAVGGLSAKQKELGNLLGFKSTQDKK